MDLRLLKAIDRHIQNLGISGHFWSVVLLWNIMFKQN